MMENDSKWCLLYKKLFHNIASISQTLMPYSIIYSPSSFVPSSHPEEEEAIILQNRYVKFPHLIICQSSVWKLHVNIPRRVSHHHCKLPQDGHIQVADITTDPLWKSHKTSALANTANSEASLSQFVLRITV